MRNFNHHDRFGSRDSGKRFFGGRDRQRMMHHAVCAKCGRDCEVPFRPSGDRPVYCSDCFEQQNGSPGGMPHRDNRNSDRPRFDNNRSQFKGDGGNNRQILEQLKELNAKLDKVISVLMPKKEETALPDLHIDDIISAPDQNAESEITTIPEEAKPKAKKTRVGRKKVKA